MANMVKITNFEQGKYTPTAGRGIRSVVMLTQEEDQDIQSFRFANQIGSKSEAMRTLIRQGLKAETKTATEQGCNPS